MSSPAWLSRRLHQWAAARRLARFRFMSMERVFTDIYRRHIWHDSETRSGSGSTYHNTAAVRAALPQWLSDLGAKTLLDLPCGDFNWLRYVELNLDLYLGADIVAELIERNQRDYGTPQRRFVQLDICRDPLPHMDVILCRDCLVHLSERAALAAIRNLIKSGSTYLITTTFPALTRNTDIVTGYWHPINLQRPPYHFPPPLRRLDEQSIGNGVIKSLGLWAIADLGQLA